MTDNEIIKWWQDEIHLAEYVDSDYRDGIKVDYIKSTLNLINRQRAENEDLKKVIETMTNEQFQIAFDFKAEIDRLKAENERFTYIHKPYIEIHCKDIAQEFADRLYKKLGVTKNYAIDEVLREMVGDDNA